MTNLNPAPPLHVDRSQVTCQKCHRPFDHFFIEEIDSLQQLRCGGVMITRTEMTCLNCGWVFHWDVRGKDLTRMTTVYRDLLARLQYAPE